MIRLLILAAALAGVAVALLRLLRYAVPVSRPWYLDETLTDDDWLDRWMQEREAA